MSDLETGWTSRLPESKVFAIDWTPPIVKDFGKLDGVRAVIKGGKNIPS